jgi:hypothetical protein
MAEQAGVEWSTCRVLDPGCFGVAREPCLYRRDLAIGQKRHNLTSFKVAYNRSDGCAGKPSRRCQPRSAARFVEGLDAALRAARYHY